MSLKIKIKENGWLAKQAAKKLQTKRVAFVLGNTIHLWNTSREEFLKDESWVKHELEHVHQFSKYGNVFFVMMYLFESIMKGYYKNKFEVAAREKEKEGAHSNDIEFI